MESKQARNYLKIFLEVSQIQINIRDKAINGRESFKKFLSNDRKVEAEKKIKSLKLERDRIEGRLDSVRLEILDMIVDKPDLVSDEILSKKNYSSVSEFIAKEKEKIEERGLYKKHPYSISEILDIALTTGINEMNILVFENQQLESTSSDVKAAVDSKNVKTMFKSM